MPLSFFIYAGEMPALPVETTKEALTMNRMHYRKLHRRVSLLFAACFLVLTLIAYAETQKIPYPRTRVLINDDWRFAKGDPQGNKTDLQYDAVKAWLLPAGNGFLSDANKQVQRPAGNLGGDVAYVAPGFDDSSWRKLDLPHDYAIEGPFTTAVSGSTGRLPSSGVVWYRKHLTLPASDAAKSIFLDIDGAMSYSMVWLNGRFVGGWPYGYASYRLNLTPYAKPGADNVLVIRLDNPVPKDSNWQSASSRWYPGAGIYRNVWLVKTARIHIGQWGTHITTPEISTASARVDLKISVDNDSKQNASVSVSTRIFEIDQNDRKAGRAVALMIPANLQIVAGRNATLETKGTIAAPKLWGTGLHQKPNRYVAVTTVRQNGKAVDTYETTFGIRTLKFDPNAGFFLNGEHIKLNGVCDHHDLGALGAAVNYRALQRQFETLAEMGANAIRTSHNPPAPELLDLADKMGFLVMDEAFDVWAQQKAALDYHLLFPEWHEQDLRALLRRDRNHPSVILWSIGNEVGEQGGGEKGAAIAKELSSICHEEDPTRPTISGMNSANTKSPFAAPIDAIGLNYQGVGIYGQPPQYPIFHQAFPDKFIVGSETASTISSRGIYTFPVAAGLGVPASANAGEDVANRQVSSYDLYSAPWSYSPDKEFAAQDRYPFLGGEFVWTGWDYLGEPTPFDASRSSYFGIIDLAGFRKDRFFIYQAYWRPTYPMAHILPHWTWPDRAGQVTPVHIYTSGDEAELFLNGKSLGRKKKAEFEYRLRWDDVVHEPGELRVVAYKGGKEWAIDSVKTAGDAAKLLLTPDRPAIASDGRDLAFITLTVADKDAQMVPRSMNLVHFEISGPGEIVATDNGDPTDMTAFPSRDRNAFNGLALVIVRAKRGQKGEIVVTAKSAGIQEAKAIIKTN
jgi:beta-galactosidase